MDAKEIESILLGLLHGKYSSITIGFNDECAPSYMTVAEEVENAERYGAESWVSEEERQRAIETNSMWTAQWYPDTPIGFYVLHASSLPALLDALASHQQESDQ